MLDPVRFYYIAAIYGKNKKTHIAEFIRYLLNVEKETAKTMMHNMQVRLLSQPVS